VGYQPSSVFLSRGTQTVSVFLLALLSISAFPISSVSQLFAIFRAVGYPSCYSFSEQWCTPTVWVFLRSGVPQLLVFCPPLLPGPPRLQSSCKRIPHFFPGSYHWFFTTSRFEETYARRQRLVVVVEGLNKHYCRRWYCNLFIYQSTAPFTAVEDLLALLFFHSSYLLPYTVRIYQRSTISS